MVNYIKVKRQWTFFSADLSLYLIFIDIPDYNLFLLLKLLKVHYLIKLFDANDRLVTISLQIDFRLLLDLFFLYSMIIIIAIAVAEANKLKCHSILRLNPAESLRHFSIYLWHAIFKLIKRKRKTPATTSKNNGITEIHRLARYLILAY